MKDQLDQSEARSTGWSDISDTELLEELQHRITRSNRTVEELTSLNDELKLVNKKLEESEALKSHFISNITNEIINPFTSILGLSRAILSVDKESWKKVISMVALIHSEAFSLDFQFRNIFFAAKLEAGETAPEVLNVDIIALLDGLLENFRYELRKKQVKVEVLNHLPQDGKSVYLFKTDPSYVKLVLANLLNNALSFSDFGTHIEITLELDGTNLLFHVQDYGKGVSTERLTELFDRFTRADSNINSMNRGYGLGLSICKAVADLLEGSITAENVAGKGARFTFSLPELQSEVRGYSSEANEIFFDAEETF